MLKLKPAISAGIFISVMFLVLLNVFTPLRLNIDVVRYLNLVEYLKGHLNESSKVTLYYFFLPHGYSLFLLSLEHIHLLTPASTTLINILSILISSYLLTTLVNIENKLIFYSLVMISYINVKQFTLPVSDQLFTMLFMISICCWSAFFKGRRYFIIPALIATFAGIYLRTAGVVIITSAFLYVVYLKREWIIKHKIVLSVLILSIIVIFVTTAFNLVYVERQIDYIRQLRLDLIIKNPFSIFSRLLIHFQELGEIAFNVPDSKLSGLVNVHQFNISQYLLITTGMLSFYVIFKAVKSLKLYNSLIFWTFVNYSFMIFLWPFYDTRFFVPIIPLLIYFYIFYFKSFFKVKYLKAFPVVIYISFGLVSVIYSDMLSLNKSFFLHHYGSDPKITNRYRIHFSNQQQGLTHVTVYDIYKDNDQYILEEYDRPPLYFLKEFNAAKK